MWPRPLAPLTSPFVSDPAFWLPPNGGVETLILRLIGLVQTAMTAFESLGRDSKLEPI